MNQSPGACHQRGGTVRWGTVGALHSVSGRSPPLPLPSSGISGLPAWLPQKDEGKSQNLLHSTARTKVLGTGPRPEEDINGRSLLLCLRRVWKGSQVLRASEGKHAVQGWLMKPGHGGVPPCQARSQGPHLFRARGPAAPPVLGLLQLLLPPHLLRLPGLLGVLLLHELPVRLHSPVSLADERDQLAHQLVLLLPRFVANLFVFFFHGSFLPAVWSLSRIIFFLPCKVLLSAETLPIGIERMDDLETKKTSNMLRFKILLLQQGSKLSVTQHISSFTHITSLLVNGRQSFRALQNKSPSRTNWVGCWMGWDLLNKQEK